MKRFFGLLGLLLLLGGCARHYGYDPLHRERYRPKARVTRKFYRKYPHAEPQPYQPY